MSKERKENIKEMTSFYSSISDTENYSENFEYPLCGDNCELFEFNGINACITECNYRSEKL